jgi:hypothetical protein
VTGIDTPVEQARAWSFDDLVREAVSLIPAYAPWWTNHNPSDPGITLLELLAYFSEILAYRALRITPDAKLHFLRLLDGGVATASDELVGAPSAVIDDAIRARVQALSHVQCAATPEDFERLALAAAAQFADGRFRVIARCVPGFDLRRGLDARHTATADAPADASVVLGVDRTLSNADVASLCHHVQEALAPNCLLTTRAHVVPATSLHVFVACRIVPLPRVSLSVVAEAVDAALQRRFDPMRSDEPHSATQPFGRPVHLATVAATIDRTAGVDYVENVVVRRMVPGGVTAEPDTLVGIRVGEVARIGEDTRLGGLASIAMRRLQTDHTGEAETILVQPWELVYVRLARDDGDGGPALSAGGRRHG